MLARDYKEGVHPPFIDSVGGATAGNYLVFDAPATSGDAQAKLPTGTTPHLLAPAGINQTSGFIGGAGTAAGEAVAITRQGLTKALLTNAKSVVRGDQLEADVGAGLGNVVARVPYSRSGWVIGTSEESYGPSTSVDPIEIYAQPRFVEICRPVFASNPTASAIGAATKFLAGPNAAVAAGEIALYRARFAETLRNLGVSLATAPGGADTVTVTFKKSSDGGATWTDVSGAGTPSVVITGAAKSGADLTNTALLAAGDLVAIKVVSSAGTAAGISVAFDAT